MRIRTNNLDANSLKTLKFKYAESLEACVNPEI
jgi:hypothetical protein